MHIQKFTKYPPKWNTTAISTGANTLGIGKAVVTTPDRDITEVYRYDFEQYPSEHLEYHILDS